MSLKHSIGKVNLRTKFLAWSTVLMIGSGLVSSAIYYRHVKQIVMNEALKKSELILQDVEAIRDYVKEVLRPKMYELHDADTFIIEAMSTTYVSLNIMQRFREKKDGYIFRRVSLNPLNPDNLADQWEEEMFDWFEADQSRTFWQGVVQEGSESYFVSMIPDYFEDRCLHCHGNPDDAPPSLIAKYGRKGGFRSEAGDLAGINSVSIPVSTPLAQLRTLTITIFITTIAATFLLLFFLNLLFGKLVISRLSRVMALLNHRDDTGKEKGPEAPNSADELDSLHESFGHLHRYVQTAQKGSDLQPNFIGAYVVEKPVVAGTMSWLYKGHHSETNEPVSIKIPFQNISVNPLYRACWRSEVKIFQHVHHPGIIKVLKREGDILVLAPLSDQKTEEGRGGWIFENIHLLFPQLCDILTGLHTMGIVHHDLRPRNFIISHDVSVKLIDLGLASWRDIPDAIFESGIGPQGDFRYMAPEQMKGMRGDPRIDIYSLGVLLYLASTGELPFEKSQSPLKTWLRYKKNFKPPSDRAKHLPPGLDEIILKAMAWDPSERYQWVEDFRDDLTDCLHTELR